MFDSIEFCNAIAHQYMRHRETRCPPKLRNDCRFCAFFTFNSTIIAVIFSRGSMTMVKTTEKIDQAVANVGSEGVFLQPKNPAPKRKRILDEDAYTQDIEDIIERDFYPDLPKLRAQLEYREAVETNNVAKLRELHIKYGSKAGTVSNQNDTPYKSPATFETPVGLGNVTPASSEDGSVRDSEANPDGHASKRVANKGLDHYLSKNTSEDNDAFDTMMAEAAERHRARYSWLFDKEIEHARYCQEALALPSAEEQATDRHRIPCLDTWAYTNQNYVMYVPDGASLTDAERQDLILKQREIAHSNTRFVRMPFNESENRQAILAAAQVQARAKEGKIGVDGKEMVPTDEPTVNGYGFVITPSPAPGVGESPMMTWGEIESTPCRLDPGNSTPGPTFRIAAVPARDKLAIELAERVGRQHRDKKQLALNAVKATLASPSPRSTQMERLASMSPAAQRLASSRLGIHLGTDKLLRQSYTPSPAASPAIGADKTPRSSLTTPTRTGKGATPKAGTPRAGAAVLASSLTDDLLKLPTRSKAADFFV